MALEEETQRQVDEVASALDALGKAVNGLAVDQAGQLRRTQRILRWTVAGLIFDLLLTLVGGLLYLQVQTNTARIQEVNARVNSQALCPLYEVFLRSYNPGSPSAQQDPAEYDRNFAVIEQGAKALGCAHTTRGR
jgi:hypothetical protein